MTQIPEAALDKHAALLGMTGSGKTSVAKAAIVEPDLEAGRRVVVIDPTGAWWGLRIKRDGKAKGFPIYIFGGEHGDYPLRATNARTLAEAFATSSDSAIFDTSLMTVSERTSFFTEFAETFRRKNKGWVRFVIDEAHLFMPQQGAKAGGGVPAMLHAGNNLVSLGRSRGLRIVLISQRAAKLHKDSLTQVHSLIALQLMSPQDRGAISDWVSDQADPVKGKEIIASLPSLVPGEAWVWAPQAHFLERVKVARPHTFDSSSAPEDGDEDGPTLAPINLDALKGRLATVEAETRANDPRALRAELAKTTAELAKLRKAPAPSLPALDPAALKTAEARGYARCRVDLALEMAKVAREVEAHVRGTSERAGQAIHAVTTLWQMIERNKVADPKIAPPGPTGARTAAPTLRVTAPHPSAPPRQAPRPAGTSNGHDSLPGPHRRVLASLSFWASVGHDAPTREQVAGVAGYSPGSGGYNNILGALATAGLIEKPQLGRVALAAGAPSVELSADEARDRLLSVLTGPERKIVDALLPDGTGGVARDEVASRTEYSAGSGGFNNLIGHLCTLCVLTKPGTGQVALADWAVQVLG